MSAPADNYIISRDASEAERLELQHKCITACQGYHLHPDIPIPTSNARIAELCTGTTVWLRELASANPTAEFHGFDLSDIMFPDRATLPENIDLHLVDVKKPFDSRWVGYFDVVHIRWIQAAMRLDEWGPVLRNIVTLLKPGGWLQWVEDDRAAGIRQTVRPAAPLDAAAQSLLVFGSHDQSQWRPPRISNFGRFNRLLIPDDRAEAMMYGYMNLDALMADPEFGDLEQVGCDGFVIDRSDDGGNVRRNWATASLIGIWSMIRVREDLGVKVADVSFDEWAARSMEEIGNGAQWMCRAMVFTGRKKAETV